LVGDEDRIPDRSLKKKTVRIYLSIQMIGEAESIVLNRFNAMDVQ
jgi:hypothetical protein